MIEISDNFTYGEVVGSYVATAKGIYNLTTSEYIINNARDLSKNIFEPLRSHYGVGFSPNSWFRCEELEEEICWKSFNKWCIDRGRKADKVSWMDYFNRKSHPTGQAGDIEIPGVSNDDLYEYIKENMEFDQLIREFRKEGDPTSGWVHVSFNEGSNRMQAFEYG